jgi:hypothetical protein
MNKNYSLGKLSVAVELISSGKKTKHYCLLDKWVLVKQHLSKKSASN